MVTGERPARTSSYRCNRCTKRCFFGPSLNLSHINTAQVPSFVKTCVPAPHSYLRQIVLACTIYPKGSHIIWLNLQCGQVNTNQNFCHRSPTAKTGQKLLRGLSQRKQFLIWPVRASTWIIINLLIVSTSNQVLYTSFGHHTQGRKQAYMPSQF